MCPVTNRKFNSLNSEVALHAQRREAHRSRTVGTSDSQWKEDGFDLGETYEKFGKEMERVMVCPPGKKIPTLSEEERTTVQELAPNAAIDDALRNNVYARRYSEWRLNAPRWLGMLEKEIRAYMTKHRNPYLREIQETYGPDIFLKIIKPVVAINRSADLHHGTDLMFIFHDPETFEHASDRDFAAEDGRPGSEATYWNADKDTVVNVDITNDIGVKMDRLEQKGQMLRADVLASKTEMMANPDVLQDFLQRDSGDLGKRKAVQNYEARVQRLAMLIVETMLVKREAKLAHLRNPEQEKNLRLQQRQAEYRGQLREATSDQNARDAQRRERERRKEEQRRAQSLAAKAEKKKRKQQNG